MSRILLFIVLLIATIGCKNVARFPIDAPNPANLDDRITGRWKFHEDTNSRNFYEILPRKKHDASNQYHAKFWNRGGTNPTYEGNIYFSKIGDALFLNLPYWEEGFTDNGFVFLKILEIDGAYSEMVVAVVGDTTMWQLNSPAEVKERIAANINNAAFYSDTFDFYKMGINDSAPSIFTR